MCHFLFRLFLVANIVPIFLEGAVSQCYNGYEEYEVKNCMSESDNNDGCYSVECLNNGASGTNIRKGCGTCTSSGMDGFFGCKCSICTGELCNIGPAKSKKDGDGAIKQCYGGQPYVLSARNHGVVNCDISNNDGCQMKICGKLHADYHKGCGKCVSAIDQNGCKCYDCVGENCNKGDAHCRSLYFSGFIYDLKFCEKWMKDADKFGEDTDD